MIWGFPDVYPDVYPMFCRFGSPVCAVATSAALRRGTDLTWAEPRGSKRAVMRLTGGLDRGRRLRAPRGAHTRPTAAKVREAIFNILGPPPDGSVLDLYAGTGALGIEALSRGAERAVFVERDHQALIVLRRNLRELGVDDRSVIIGADVCTALRRLGAKKQQFSWVFLDPPYVKETEGVLAELSGGEL